MSASPCWLTGRPALQGSSFLLCPFFSFHFFMSGSRCVTQAGLELVIPLPQPMKDWDYTCVLVCFDSFPIFQSPSCPLSSLSRSWQAAGACALSVAALGVGQGSAVAGSALGLLPSRPSFWSSSSALLPVPAARFPRLQGAQEPLASTVSSPSRCARAASGPLHDSTPPLLLQVATEKLHS